MPVKPSFEWEQTHDDVFLHVTIKGFKKDAVDVFVSDVFAKVNAPPTYLLTLDLLHPVDPDGSSHHIDAEDATLLHVRLRKAEPGLIWDALCLTVTAAGGKTSLLERRAASMRRAEERYRERLEARGRQREVERRRMTEEQWEVEKRQRSVIERRFQAEKTAAEEELFEWEDTQRAAAADGGGGAGAAAAVPRSPADIVAAAAAASAAAPAPAPAATKERAAATTADAAPLRGTDTVNVTIDFTPKMFAMPTRSRGDDDYYRRSRYKPVSVEDSPMFWKERGDALYKAHDWQGSANAYSESIKRDGVFLTCVMNRASCFLQLAEFKRAAEDCTLALTMLANTPASEMTQERYRAIMTKLHARRGAALCWNGELAKGLVDLRMAAAYRDTTEDDDIVQDVATVERVMAERGLQAEDGEGTAEEKAVSAKMLAASSLYYANKHEESAAAYRDVLEANPFHAHARSNLAAALLQQGQFKDALRECEKVIAFCAEVAEALNQPGALDANDADSDDEDEPEGGAAAAASSSSPSAEDGGNRDEMMRKRRAAARKISESSGHVYLLLKAYVRSAAAHCGLGEFHAAHGFLERALRITPYDNDLLDDCNRLTEKIRMDTIVAASAGTLKA